MPRFYDLAPDQNRIVSLSRFNKKAVGFYIRCLVFTTAATHNDETLLNFFARHVDCKDAAARRDEEVLQSKETDMTTDAMDLPLAMSSTDGDSSELIDR